MNMFHGPGDEYPRQQQDLCMRSKKSNAHALQAYFT